MEMLGARIAKLRPGKKVLVLANPFTKNSGIFQENRQYEKAGLRGLKNGLGESGSMEIVSPEIRPDYLSNPQSVFIPPESRTPLSFLIRASSVDELAKAHPECQVIVSLIGLPAGVEKLNVWSETDHRCFALLAPDLRLLGPPANAVSAFQQGKLLAVVVENIESGGPLIVTQDNIFDVIKRQPKVLGF